MYNSQNANQRKRTKARKIRQRTDVAGYRMTDSLCLSCRTAGASARSFERPGRSWADGEGTAGRRSQRSRPRGTNQARRIQPLTDFEPAPLVRPRLGNVGRMGSTKPAAQDVVLGRGSRPNI